jgi:hypothetical protein
MPRSILVGVIAGVGVTVGLQLLHAAGMGEVPVLDAVLLRPGGLATWLFVLGDVGTPLQYAVWPLLISCCINAVVGAGLGWLAGAVWRRRPSGRGDASG